MCTVRGKRITLKSMRKTHSLVRKMKYSPMQVNVIKYKEIQYIVMHYNAVQLKIIKMNSMQCNAMQCNALHCNALHCTAMQCNAMQCNAMQCNAMQCNAMQCNAMHSNLHRNDASWRISKGSLVLIRLNDLLTACFVNNATQDHTAVTAYLLFAFTENGVPDVSSSQLIDGGVSPEIGKWQRRAIIEAVSTGIIQLDSPSSQNK